MGVPAPLRRKLRDKLGTDTGEEFVSWLDEMRAEHARDRREMADLLHGVEARLTEQIHAVELSVREVQSNLMKWSFVFWCGAVAAIAALAGVLRQ
jgi:hypothetical protein